MTRAMSSLERELRNASVDIRGVEFVELELAVSMLSAGEGHVLSFPPHLNGFYATSALCSCGKFQWDHDSCEGLDAARDEVWRDWEQHISESKGSIDTALLRTALASAEQDLLWAMLAISRLGWPMSIAEFFTYLRQPSLIAEYQQVQNNIAARKELLA